MLYWLRCPAETRQREEVNCYGYWDYFSCHCCGRCDLPPHLQMARQAWQGQQVAWWTLDHLKKVRRNPGLYATTIRGFVLCYKYSWDYFLPTGIIAYADLEINIPVLYKSMIFFADWHKIGIISMLYRFYQIKNSLKSRHFETSCKINYFILSKIIALTQILSYDTY